MRLLGVVHTFKEIYAAIVTNLPVFAASAVIAALVSGWVSLRNSARVIQAEYITGERAKWRDRVRCVALKVHEAAGSGDTNRLAELLLELTLFLNVKDPMDAEILDLVRSLRISQKAQAPPSEFGERIALLLKHDWDRAKREAQPFFRWLSRPPKRMPYEEFQQAEQSRKKLTTSPL